MSKLFSKAKDKFFLLLFILIFIVFLTTLFGQASTYISVFVLTALLMFKEMDLGLHKFASALFFPLTFLVVTLVPEWLMKSQSLLLNGLLVVSLVLGILFLLGRTLIYQSYIPFLFLFALNQGDQSPLLPRVLAAGVGGVGVSLVYFLYAKKRQQPFHISLEVSLVAAFKKQRLFISKLTLGILAAYLLGTCFATVKVAWIILTVISLTQLDFKRTQQRFKSRIAGTLIGVSLYLILFIILIPASWLPIILLVVSYGYMFITDYFIKMIFITINALNAAIMTFNFPQNEMLVERLLFIILGALIAYLIGYYFEHFPSVKIRRLEKK